MATRQTTSESLAEFWNQLAQNRVGLIGFGLSLLQLAVHAAWLLFVAWLSASGRAEQLKSDDWELWLISILIIIAAVLTMVSLFMCLYGIIHGKPRVLAILGLTLSFFIGALTTTILLLNAFAAS